jgi:hypothetical protein
MLLALLLHKLRRMIAARRLTTSREDGAATAKILKRKSRWSHFNLMNARREAWKKIKNLQQI